MGILDDAIREHLELKRKHGVAEEELQREEEEALGPARRDVAQRREDAEPTPGHSATADNGEPAGPTAAEETALFDMEHAEVEEGGPRTEGAGEDEPASPAIAHDDPAIHEPAAAAEVAAAEPPDAADEREPDEEELLGAEPEDEEVEDQEELEDEDPDVLEDTPDFLQETPEHDRLWFEQKPPRDFDFD